MRPIISRYRKKPQIIMAMEFKKEDLDHARIWLKDKLFYKWFGLDRGGGGWHIRTLEGNMKVVWGDYIIKGIKGEFYPCKAGIFKRLHDYADI